MVDETQITQPYYQRSASLGCQIQKTSQSSDICPVHGKGSDDLKGVMMNNDLQDRGCIAAQKKSGASDLSEHSHVDKFAPAGRAIRTSTTSAISKVRCVGPRIKFP